MFGNKSLGAFSSCQSGNFSVIFGLSLIPMVLMIGLAVDTSRTMRVKTALDAAADAAALSAVTQASRTMQQQTKSYDPTNDAIYQGTYAGQAMFAADSGRFSSANVSPNVSVQKTTTNGTTSMTATVTYTAAPPTAFGNFLGVLKNGTKVPVFNISGKSVSAMSLKKYINIYVIVDVSQSMGIAGSTADMQKLFDATNSAKPGKGCVFGCHVVKSDEPALNPAMTNEDIAHANNISLRIDVIKSAISNMIDQAKSTESQAGGASVSIGLSTFEQDVKQLTAPVDATNYYSTLQAYTKPVSQNAQAIDLGSETDGGGHADSYAQTSLKTFADSLPANGAGDSPSTPANYVFIMTDGTFDVTYDSTVAASCPATYYNPSHCVNAFDTTWGWVKTMQNKATVGVIYTTYLPLYNNNDKTQGLQGDYNHLIQPIAANIGPNLEASATSNSWFIEASDSSTINSALSTMFAKAALAGRLTQ